MGKICRTCLDRIGDNDHYYCMWSNANAVSEGSLCFLLRTKLKTLVPEISLDLVSNSVICHTCLNKLGIAYAFKTKCLETEAKIHDYFANADLTKGSPNLGILEEIVNKAGFVSRETLDSNKHRDRSSSETRKRSFSSNNENDLDGIKRPCFNQQQRNECGNEDISMSNGKNVRQVNNIRPCINSNEIFITAVPKNVCSQTESDSRSFPSSLGTFVDTGEIQNSITKYCVALHAEKTIDNFNKKLRSNGIHSSSFTATRHSVDSNKNATCIEPTSNKPIYIITNIDSIHSNNVTATIHSVDTNTNTTHIEQTTSSTPLYNRTQIDSIHSNNVTTTRHSVDTMKNATRVEQATSSTTLYNRRNIDSIHSNNVTTTRHSVDTKKNATPVEQATSSTPLYNRTNIDSIRSNNVTTTRHSVDTKRNATRVEQATSSTPLYNRTNIDSICSNNLTTTGQSVDTKKHATRVGQATASTPLYNRRNIDSIRSNNITATGQSVDTAKNATRVEQTTSSKPLCNRTNIDSIHSYNVTAMRHSVDTKKNATRVEQTTSSKPLCNRTNIDSILSNHVTTTRDSVDTSKNLDNDSIHSNNITATRHSVDTNIDATHVEQITLSTNAAKTYLNTARSVSTDNNKNTPVILSNPEGIPVVSDCNTSAKYQWLQVCPTSTEKRPYKPIGKYRRKLIDSLKKNKNKNISHVENCMVPLVVGLPSNNSLMDTSSQPPSNITDQSSKAELQIYQIRAKTDLGNKRPALLKVLAAYKNMGPKSACKVRSTFNGQRKIESNLVEDAMAPKKYLQVKSPNELLESPSQGSDNSSLSLEPLLTSNVPVVLNESVDTLDTRGLCPRIVLKEPNNPVTNNQFSNLTHSKEEIKFEVDICESFVANFSDLTHSKEEITPEVDCKSFLASFKDCRTGDDSKSLRNCSVKLTILSQQDLCDATKSSNLCYLCGFKSSELQKLIEHYKLIHKDRVYHCCMCSYASPDLNIFEVHINIHIAQLEYDYRCDKITYKCKLCKFNTKKRINMQIHLKLHSLAGSNISNYSCSYCVWMSSNADEIYKHMKIHWDEIFYLCSCNIGYTNRKQFKRHVMNHGPRMHKCVQCNFQSTCVSYLRNHYLDKHYITGPYKCYHCNRVYSLRVAILKHVLQLKIDVNITREIVSLEHSYACEL